jgi:Branched-chain amino acid transport system / permease component
MRTGRYKETYGALVALTDSNAARGWTGLLLLALLLPALHNNYVLSLATATMISVVGAVGLNLLTGLIGLISIGQSAFLAIGAYTNALLLADRHWPVWASLPAAGIVAAVLSLLVGIPSLRLSRSHHPLCRGPDARAKRWVPAGGAASRPGRHQGPAAVLRRPRRHDPRGARGDKRQAHLYRPRLHGNPRP